MEEKLLPVGVQKEEYASQPKYFRLNKAYQFQELLRFGKFKKTEHFSICFLNKPESDLGFAIKATKKKFQKST